MRGCSRGLLAGGPPSSEGGGGDERDAVEPGDPPAGKEAKGAAVEAREDVLAGDLPSLLATTSFGLAAATDPSVTLCSGGAMADPSTTHRTSLQKASGSLRLVSFLCCFWKSFAFLLPAGPWDWNRNKFTP